MDIRPEPQIIEIEKFDSVANHYDTFFFHFISKNHNHETNLSLRSLYLLDNEYAENNNPLKDLQEILNIDIFESYTKDSVDFLNNLGIPFDKIYNNRTKQFSPFFLGFRNKKFLGGTNVTTSCHCINGVTDVVYQTNPKIFESISELGIEKEDLK
jgi:hypothetical protein